MVPVGAVYLLLVLFPKQLSYQLFKNFKTNTLHFLKNREFAAIFFASQSG